MKQSWYQLLFASDFSCNHEGEDLRLSEIERDSHTYKEDVMVTSRKAGHLRKKEDDAKQIPPVPTTPPPNPFMPAPRSFDIDLESGRGMSGL